MKREIKESYVWIGLCAVSVLFLLLFSPYTTPLNDYFGYDTALWHVIGRGITQGFVPYRDLFEHKGPLLFFMYAFSWLFENQRLAMYFLQCVFFAVTVCYMYKLCRLFTVQIKALAGVGFFLLLFCGTIGEGAMSEEWSLPFLVISLYYALKYLLFEQEEREHPVGYGFLYGVCFGAAAMIRLNNAAPIAGVVLAFIILMIKKKKIACIFKNAAAFFIGMLLPVIPIVIWYWQKDALEYLWWGAFLFNFHYAVNAEVVQPLWEIIRPWLMTICYIPVLCMAFPKGEKEEKRRDGKFLVLVSAVVTMVILLFGSSFLHYYTILLPYLAVTFSMITEKWKTGYRKPLLALAAVCMVLPFLWQGARNAGKTILFNVGGWYDQMETEIYDFLSQIPEEERDSVWGNGTSFSKVFCIAGITPCFPYFDNGPVHYTMDPAMHEETERMFTDNPPKWIVVATLGESQIPSLTENAEEKYELEDILEGEKHLELYRLKEEYR